MERKQLLKKLDALPRPHRSCIGCVAVGACEGRCVGQSSLHCHGWSPSDGAIRFLSKLIRVR